MAREGGLGHVRGDRAARPGMFAAYAASSTPELVSTETTASTSQPASSGPFGAKREILRFERVRGGPERTRTACQARSHIEPVSETSQTARFVGLEPVSSCPLESRRETEFFELETKWRKPGLAVQGQDQRLISNGQGPPFRHYSSVSRKILEWWDWVADRRGLSCQAPSQRQLPK